MERSCASKKRCGAGVLRARVLTTRPLDRYHHKGLISDTQWFAVDKFSRDWHIGCQGARVTSLYDVRIVGGAVDNDAWWMLVSV